MGVLTQRVHAKLNKPAWRSFRDSFMQVSEVLLAISSDAQGELAGTYVKFASSPTRATYAAVWPKISRPMRLVVGLALPDEFEAEHLGPAPERIFYPGLTKFLVIIEGQAIPEELSAWAKRAYEHILALEKCRDGPRP
jgi:hypothetical protein